MGNQLKRVLVISNEFFYALAILLSIKDLIDKTIEIVNPGLPRTVKLSEEALGLIEEHKPDVILLDHFLSGTPMDRILGKIKPEDGEGIDIAQETNFFYIGEVKPDIISISTRQKSEVELLYGNRVKHYCEGDMLKLRKCLKGECLC
ncbi:MAG: hypothetical protein UT90_C0015G0011 [Parcubacteria group bacterium GW2011_GWA1_40_21]|nr:MAG: hypothetical protein UT80_C0027G0009 [Parcubacteria group bacterium GW2011_GWC1_40_13]KKR53074.1 MAG: hypothetical protein UT90_C0015G0011 [Parcubacteria group bacterium GW2011_GWA1_40_21]